MPMVMPAIKIAIMMIFFVPWGFLEEDIFTPFSTSHYGESPILMDLDDQLVPN
jgi:hypothetical protein